jgi:YEATS domain-containing protein 4
MSDLDTFTTPNGESRIRGGEVVCPVVMGTVAWYLGKKASETMTHKWTVYVRGARGQDLSYCIKKVVFQLHSSFAVPLRPMEQQPFEVVEGGWGEFEIGIQLYFQDDCCEKPLELAHKLKLYTDDDRHPQQSSKKPVVSETYEELVFSEPTEAFWRRAGEQGSLPAPEPQLSCSAYVGAFNPQDDLRRIHNSRQRVAMMQGPLATQPSAAVAT